MNTTITVPDNLNEITVWQYQKYLSVTEGLEGEFLNQRTVEMLCGISFSKVVLMSHKDVKEIAESLRVLLSKEVEFKHRFKIKSQEFGFMPDLENMTSGEYADLCAYIGNEHEMHKTMAVMFRPITYRVGQKYEIFPYKGTSEFSEVMKFMPLGIALGAMVFFLNLAKELVQATQTFSKQEVMSQMKRQFPTLAKNGAFTKTSIHLQKEMLQSLTKSAQ